MYNLYDTFHKISYSFSGNISVLINNIKVRKCYIKIKQPDFELFTVIRLLFSELCLFYEIQFLWKAKSSMYINSFIFFKSDKYVVHFLLLRIKVSWIYVRYMAGKRRLFSLNQLWAPQARSTVANAWLSSHPSATVIDRCVQQPLRKRSHALFTCFMYHSTCSHST
jgi:hypothetical protein